MSAETLRRAAALMRERAEAANHTGRSGWAGGWKNVIATTHMPHVKSWHPVVALAVADWLDATAAENDSPDDSALGFLNFIGADALAALTVARAYLGESA